MGREVRRVPPDWKHPISSKYGEEKGEPLHEGYNVALAEFEAMYKKEGLQKALDWFGVAPNKDDYMPEWPDEARTHYQMYENTSEGTPISPVMPDPESLARWLADNNASSFGSSTATYEQWLNIAQGDWAPSMVMVGGKMMSGVEAMLTLPKKPVE